jgi:flagellar protein FlaI
MNKSTNVTYENISFDINGRKYKIVSSAIKWNSKTNSLMYYVNEPDVNQDDRLVITQLKELLSKSNKRNLSNIGEVAKINANLKKKLNIQTASAQDAIVNYYVYRDIFGYGKLEGLIWDPKVKLISFDRIGAPLMIFHEDYKIIPSNIIIASDNELSNLKQLLKDKCVYKNENREMLNGKTQTDAVLFINKITDTFTIRKLNDKVYHPTALIMKIGLANVEMLAFIEFFLRNKGSILVIGSEYSNKTEFVSGLGSILGDSKILTFENVPEIKLLSENWIPEVLPVHIYTQSDIVENLIRQKPEYVIADGIGGKELKKIINGIPKHYSGIITLKASSIEEGLEILTSEPINLDSNSMPNFDLIILLSMEKHGLRYLHRIKKIVEVIDYITEDSKLKLNTVFELDNKRDKFIPYKSLLIEKFVRKTGMHPSKLVEDLKNSIKTFRRLSR